jgi:hypothetical protein
MNLQVNTHCDAIVQRWLRITPSTGNRSFEIASSSIRLVREYLRRAAHVVRSQDALKDLTTRDLIFADLAEIIIPRSCDKSIDEALASWRVDASLRYAKTVAHNHVHWTAIAGLNCLDAPELHEPLLRLFERGGELFTHHGFIHVNHCNCFWPAPVAAYIESEPMTDLSDGALDPLDNR